MFQVFRSIRSTMLLLVMMLLTQVGWGQVAAWNFFGLSSPASATATTFNSNLISTAGADLITRGSSAVASSASNSFRTQGFKNDGISVSNTDYFQVTLSAANGYILSLSTIDAYFAGTSSFFASPGISDQFAYSLDGSNFILIGSIQNRTSAGAMSQINLSSISALQNVPAGTTVTIRYYASGQTTTGGWGFNSPNISTNGLSINGSLDAVSGTPSISTSPNSLSGFSSILGSASIEQTYTVSGSDLSSDITLTAPTGYEISESSGSGFASSLNLTPTSGTVSATPIYVRLSSSASVGVISGDITHSSSGATTQTVSLSGNVYNVEPSDHVTSFACGTTGSSTIPLSWVDASGSVTPDGYLIKWSNVSYADIVDPVDGTSESNGAGKRNVAFGAQAVTISGLAQTTTYYFKIFPFTNSGANIDYKTDGAIPQTTCSTIAGPWENFEIGSKGGYTLGSVTCSAGEWLMDDALLGGSVDDRVRDFKSVRLRNSGSITMNFNVTNGIGLLRLYHGVYGTDLASSFVVEASTDNGITWSAYLSPEITSSSTTLSQQSFLINLTGAVRVRVRKTGGGSNRINIDDINFTENAPVLPVTLLSFSGYKDGVRNQLRWVTATESNNTGFQVERSSDGLNYQSIGFVRSLSIDGNSQTQLKYNFVDASPAGIKQYYRLKQLDIDGRSSLSNILLIQGEKPTSFEIASVFPNPSRGQVTMLLSAPANETVSIRVLDLAGRILETRQVNVLAGNNSIPFDLSNQAKGQYLISVGEKVVRVVRE